MGRMRRLSLRAKSWLCGRTESRLPGRTKLRTWSVSLAATLSAELTIPLSAELIAALDVRRKALQPLETGAAAVCVRLRRRSSRRTTRRRRALRSDATLAATATLTARTRATLAVLTAAPGSVRRTLRTTAGRHGRTGFLHGQFTVVILVQGQERFGGIGDLLFVYLPVLVGIQRRHDGRNHPPPLRSARLARLPGLISRLTRLGRRRLSRRDGRSRRDRIIRRCGVLREQGPSGGQKSQQ